MRAFFLKDGRIRRVLMFPTFTDEEAIKRAREIFDENKESFDGFEVWHETRHVHDEGKPFVPNDAAEKLSPPK